MRLLIWLVLIYVGFKMAQGFLKGKGEVEKPLPPRGEETHRDPVCGVYVAEEDAVIGRVEDERLFFCSMACLEKYREQLQHKS